MPSYRLFFITAIIIIVVCNAIRLPGVSAASEGGVTLNAKPQSFSFVSQVKGTAGQ